MTTRTRSLATIWQRPIRLDEAGGAARSWIMLMPLGEFEHPDYGKLDFNRAKLAKFKANFDNRVRKIDIALDADHRAPKDDSRATGWIRQVEIRDPLADQPGGLWGLIDWTPYGVSFLHSQEYRYFSPEFGKYTDEESGEVFDDVIIGGALTNRPFLKVMPAITLAEVSHRAWSSVDKSTLPRSCFLIQGDPSNKSTWKLPVYEWLGGKRVLNANAVTSALAAVHGARSGKPMTGVPSSVRQRLERWSAQLQKGDAKQMANKKLAAPTTPLKKSRSAGAKASRVEDYDPDSIDDATAFDDSDSSDDDAGADTGTADMDEGDDDNESYDDSDSDDDSLDDGDNDEDDMTASSRKRMSRKASTKASAKTSSKTSSKSSGKKMSEVPTAMRDRQSEELRVLREQVAETNYRLYERDMDDILRMWSAGKTVQLSELEVPSLPKVTEFVGGKRVTKTAKLVLTPKARAVIKDYMLEHAYRLNDTGRSHLLHLIQTLLSETAQVRVDQMSNAFDQETRRNGPSRVARETPLAGEDIQEIAEQLAKSANKTLSELSTEEQVKFYMAAEREASRY